MSYLANMVHNIGAQLKTTAVCTQVRRIRYGYFTLDHALLQQDWSAQQIVDNISMCKPLVTYNKLVHSPGILQLSKQELEQLTSGERQPEMLDNPQAQLKQLDSGVARWGQRDELQEQLSNRDRQSKQLDSEKKWRNSGDKHSDRLNSGSPREMLQRGLSRKSPPR